MTIRKKGNIIKKKVFMCWAKLKYSKLNGVASLMTDPPPTSSLLFWKRKEEKCMWHVKYDIFWIMESTTWIFPKNFRSLAITVWEWRRLKHIFRKDQLLKRLCKTAPLYESHSVQLTFAEWFLRVLAR